MLPARTMSFRSDWGESVTLSPQLLAQHPADGYVLAEGDIGLSTVVHWVRAKYMKDFNGILGGPKCDCPKCRTKKWKAKWRRGRAV